MSAPVDAMAVLREQLAEVEAMGHIARKLRAAQGLPPDDSIEQLRQAVGAVAELIEADKAYDADIEAAKELNRRIAERGWYEVEFDALRKSGELVVASQIRRQRALAAFGGAA
ncbi:MAG: hypothetical protein ACTHJ9_05340 [Rhodanobacter sp.]